MEEWCQIRAALRSPSVSLFQNGARTVLKGRRDDGDALANPRRRHSVTKRVGVAYVPTPSRLTQQTETAGEHEEETPRWNDYIGGGCFISNACTVGLIASAILF